MSPARRRTVRDCVSAWLAEKKASVREPTWLDYHEKASRYILPYLGTRPIRRLAPADLLAWHATLAERGLSRRSVWYAHEIMLQALEAAVRAGALVMNPARQARPAAYRRSDASRLSAAELDRFLAVARTDEFAPLWYLIAAAGMRPTEAVALHWDHVDLAQNRARVDCTLRNLGPGRWEAFPLRHAGQRRDVYLSDVTCGVLLRHRRAQAAARLAVGPAWIDLGFVLSEPSGLPLNWKRVTGRHFRGLLAKAGLPRIPPYTLRYSCVATMLESGLDLQSIARRLGYTSISRMLDHTDRVSPGLTGGNPSGSGLPHARSSWPRDV